jgi:1-acyl-sn-glycerol-3-phosphate acyltransferase
MDSRLERHGRLFHLIGLPLARLLAWILLKLLGPTAVRGKEHVPRTGGLLILASHQSDVDPVVVQHACPRPIYFMAKSELFEMRGLGRVIRWFKAFPVKRGEPDRESIRKAVAHLKNGDVVCVFPEGQLSETGALQPLKPGVALIVRMAGCPVICCGLDGTNRIMPFGTMLPRPAFRRVWIKWGRPREFDRSAETDDIVAWATDELTKLTAGSSSGLSVG